MAIRGSRAEAAVVGHGRLADFVERNLQEHHAVMRHGGPIRDLPEAVRLVLLLHDEWQPDAMLEDGAQLQKFGRPWLSAYMMRREGIVGPFVRPRNPGCSQCAHHRWSVAGQDREEVLETQFSMLMHGRIVREKPLRAAQIRHIANLAVEEARRFLQGGEPLTEGRLYLVDSESMSCSLHRFLPDPACKVCGGLPEDTPEAARLTLPPSKKSSPDGYRCIPESDLHAALLDTYFDEKTGIVTRKANILTSPFAEVGMILLSSQGKEIVGGRSHVFAASETTAVLEGLERLCGMSPRGKRTVVFDSYHRFAPDTALDPVTVGVYSEAQYGSPDFPFEPFDPNQPIPWVWGYSMARKSPLLVPEQLAYYSGSGFVHEFSNGCSVGGSLAEAIFHGILEVVERDSFLLTWYTRLPLPPLDPSTVEDRTFQLMMERMRSIAGYDVRFFNSTMEHGIPSIWAIAKRIKPEGPNLLCSAGAHVDIVRAAKSAIFELAGGIGRVEAELNAHRDAVPGMLHDPYLVERMEDHALLYSLPEAESRLSFLLQREEPMRPFDRSFPRPESREDMADELQHLVEKVLRRGLDVIVVDQTSPELSIRGLHCVKVLIPGLLPMAFGYTLTRLTGLDRVRRIPMELGYRTGELAPSEVNPHPHPFL